MTRFVVHGLPVTQGSKRAFVRNGRAVVTESAGKRHSDWRARVAAAAQEAHPGPLVTGPVEVCVLFGLPKPASAPKRRQTWPIGARSGDVDKLARSVLDSLTGVVWHDDSQVTMLTATKDYSDQPGVHVTVTWDDGS